jgi:parallel beta-helix repeat protein
MLKALLFFLLISIQLIAQTTYYVSNSQGNDSNNGTSQSSPWKTLSKVTNAALNPGDQILFRRGDIWSGDRLTVSRSGNQSSPIIFKTYDSGNKPVINGNNAFNDFIIRIQSNRQYIVFEDIEFIGLNYAISSSFPGTVKLEQRANNISFIGCKFSTNTFDIEQWKGIVMMIDPHTINFENCEFSGTMMAVNSIANYNNSHNDVHHLTFRNNWFHDLDPRTVGGQPIRGRAINFFTWWETSPDLIGDGSTPGTTFGHEGTVRDIIIDNNTFERITHNVIDWYWHHNFTVAKVKGYNWQITNNIARNNGFNFCDLAPVGWRGGIANRSVVSGNIIDSSGWDYTNGSVLTIPDAGFVNVIQTHNWDNWIIENNIISNLTQEMGDGHAIVMDYTLNDNTYKCDSITIRNNILSGAKPSSAYGEVSASGINLYTSRFVQVYNNVIYNNNNGIYFTNRTENALVYNNTIDGNLRAGIYTGGDQNTEIRNNLLTNNGGEGLRKGGTQPGFTASHNLFFGNGNSSTTGSNNQTGTPNYVNRNLKDYRILQGGAGIDAGTLVSGNFVPRLFDMLGNVVPYNITWDIGAYEYGSTGGGSNNINVNLNILLEGSFNNGSMSTTLTNDGHLPLNQPYNQAPWNYSGNQTVASIPSGVVDWVLLELRTGTSATTTIVRKAAFLKSDGSVVALDGVSKVTFDGLPAGSYYVVIRHRNHLAVMSANTLSLSDNSSLYDFTTGPGKAYGTNPMSDLGNGKWGMTAGDGDINGLVNVIDYGTVGNFLFATGYIFGDLDMNGVINVMDYAKTNLNLFKNSQVPN